jgi:hypothetical protein
MDIVTLTCNRDIRQTIIQAESIQNFVKPCRHWVVVNQYQPTESLKQRWRNYLKPFYKKHKLVLVFPQDLQTYNTSYEPLLDHQGYGNTGPLRNSSYWLGFKYQFTIAEQVQDDYLCLNAKNFFIKPCNTADLRSIIGNSWPVTYPDDIGDQELKQWTKGLHEISKFFNEPVPDYLLSIQAPSVVNYSKLKERIADFQKYANWWDEMSDLAHSTGMHFADWHFYSFVIRDLIHPDQRKDVFYWGNWPSTYDFYKSDYAQWKYALTNPSLKITMFHRLFLEKCTNFELELLNVWMRELGFKTRVKKLHLKKDW